MFNHDEPAPTIIEHYRPLSTKMKQEQSGYSLRLTSCYCSTETSTSILFATYESSGCSSPAQHSQLLIMRTGLHQPEKKDEPPKNPAAVRPLLSESNSPVGHGPPATLQGRRQPGSVVLQLEVLRREGAVAVLRAGATAKCWRSVVNLGGPN